MTVTQDLYVNGRMFTADGPAWASALLVEGERICYAGDADTARRIGSSATEIDLEGALVVPGFVDGHAHVLSTGQAAEEVDLVSAPDLTEIQRRLAGWASRHPGGGRMRARGWLHSAVPGGHPVRQMLDAAVSDRAVYAFSNDFHSVWLNTAALAEVGIGAQTPDPPGGKIVRDPASGEPTGHIDETAMHLLVVPLLDTAATDSDRDRYLAQALAGYRASGVTGVTDMALNAATLRVMSRAEEAGTMTARVAGHWIIRRDEDPAANLAQVAKAAQLAAWHRSPFLRVTGIKVVIDGTVDGCTAALGEPYADGSLADPIWDLPALEPVVTAADAAGLQVAMHAIGDEAIRIAIGAVEAAVRANGPKRRRHRIEHLEVVTEAEITRLAALGIVASMQPVHADPAIQANWRAMLGDERSGRGYPWPEMTEAGAVLAFGTDSPTAPSQPLPNMFVAATRRSAFDPGLAPNIGEYALPLAAAIGHATRDAAWACQAENEQGRLAGGLLADFAVIDRDVLSQDPAELLQARVLRTVVGGQTVYQA
jgi:predicted amidohydrolase YtcJ